MIKVANKKILLIEMSKLFLVMILLPVAVSMAIILLPIAVSLPLFLVSDYRDKIEPMPFDSRLCTNTGKMHRYIVIGEKGAVIERYEPVLDCTNLDKYNGV